MQRKASASARWIMPMMFLEGISHPKSTCMKFEQLEQTAARKHEILSCTRSIFFHDHVSRFAKLIFCAYFLCGFISNSKKNKEDERGERMRRPEQSHASLERELALLSQQYDLLDPSTPLAIKRRARMIKNRLSAKRSREQARE
jgi:hypothetical protein